MSQLAHSSIHSLETVKPDFSELFAWIRAGAADRDHGRILPFDVIRRVRESRLGALRLPRASGGFGVSSRDLFRVVLDLAAADPNVAHILRNHLSFVDRFALPAGARGAALKWLPDIAAGAIVGLAMTEQGAGKVGGGVSTYATALTPDGAGFRLNGRKFYSTGALFSDILLVRAAGPDGRNLSVLLPTRRDGVELVDDWDGAGQRLTGSGSTVLHNVRVEADEVLPDEPGSGFGLPYSNTLAQLLVTAIVAGILRNVATDAGDLVRSRRDRNFYYSSAERPEDDPLLQEVVGRIGADAWTAETLILAAADAHDALSGARVRGEPDEELAHHAAVLTARAKLVVDELTLRSATRLFDVGGASATQRGKNLDRHWRNARTLASHNPTTLKAQALGAWELTGTPLPKLGFF
ncbi:acyl-CoA dehydrogenase family protein [Camelimonas sp. ID_303_24]